MTRDETITQNAPDFSDLLRRAVEEPGVLSEAYRAFYDYSIGNQLLALFQCHAREIPPGPLATFKRWQDRGRHVKRGEKALTLCMPVTMKARTATGEAEQQGELPLERTFTRFVYRARWFVLAQTDGTPYEVPVPEWDAQRALAALQITEVPFEALDGNCQGYARGREVAISPIAELPYKTRFHEVAHVVLGHTAEEDAPLAEQTSRSMREVEAEAVALICLSVLGLPGAQHCRGYIQHWNTERRGRAIPDSNARRIFKAADAILKAGRSEDVTTNGGHDA